MTKRTSSSEKAPTRSDEGLRDRAARTRDAVVQRAKQHQPQPASIPAETPADSSPAAFTSPAQTRQGGNRGRPDDHACEPAAGGQAPHQEQSMGRHETFGASTPLTSDLLATTRMPFGSPVDPVFAVLAEARRLWKLHDTLLHSREDGEASEEEDDAHGSLWAYVRGPLLNTVPQTAEGCRALALFANEFTADQGVPIIESDGTEDPVLALIARSPLNAEVDPFEGVPCPPGFVPFPAHKPQSFMNIPTMIEVEAGRLLQIAQREYFRCTSGLGHIEPGEAAEIRAAHRWKLGLDDLERLAERREGWTGPVGARPDPALQAIASHRAAYRDWEPHLDRITETVTGTPEFAAAEAVGEPARLAEEAAFSRLFEKWPVTLAGLLAWAEYLPSAVMQNGRSQPDDDGVKALDTLCFVVKHLARQGRIMADTCPLPVPAPTPFAPADLADACDWAVRQVDWINSPSDDEHWTDEKTDIELDKNGAVWKRALAEPSRSLRDLAAKARMVQQDWLNHNPTDEEMGDDCERLTLKILREVIAFAGRSENLVGPSSRELPNAAVLVAALDIAAQPMSDLLALRDVADTISSVAYGMAFHARSEADRGQPNVAGQFAIWIAETATEVQDKAQSDARARKPKHEDEAEHRFMIIARSDAANGDPEELRSLGLDFEALARRIEARG